MTAVGGEKWNKEVTIASSYRLELSKSFVSCVVEDGCGFEDCQVQEWVVEEKEGTAS
jgi:hypothetical protein